MDRKTKEEKIVEHGEKVVEDFQDLYDKEARAVTEYNKLLDEYRRLNKRFNKIISMNDAVSKDVIVNNDNLKDSVDYTIKAAREKLLSNVAEHRKTKESSGMHITKIAKLEDALRQSYSENASLEKKIAYYIKKIEKVKLNY